MNRSQYKAITTGSTGPAVRSLLNSMVVQSGRLAPTRSQLRAQLAELPVDDNVRQGLWDAAVKLHKRAQESDARHFELRQEADLEAVKVMEGLARADRLIDDGSPVHPDPGGDSETADAVQDAIDALGPGKHNLPPAHVAPNPPRG